MRQFVWFGSVATVGLAGGALGTGCAQWPRAGNLGDDPGYVGAGDVVTLPAQYNDTENEAVRGDFPQYPIDDGQDPPTAPPSLNIDQFGVARRFAGTLDGAGWSDEPFDDSVIDTDCEQLGPLDTGYYDGDADALIVANTSVEGFLCVRGRLETADRVGWDLIALDVSGACPVPVTGGAELPLGSNQSDADVVWGLNVPPGSYALLIGAYYPGDPDFTADYVVGVSLWAPFDGSPEQCPALGEVE